MIITLGYKKMLMYCLFKNLVFIETLGVTEQDYVRKEIFHSVSSIKNEIKLSKIAFLTNFDAL